MGLNAEGQHLLLRSQERLAREGRVSGERVELLHLGVDCLSRAQHGRQTGTNPLLEGVVLDAGLERCSADGGDSTANGQHRLADLRPLPAHLLSGT
ncbi:hypothetical protein JL108_06110 [Aeromicrobium sp. YIM 150415]|uniref:hypothetical protein n=1 Tax=Aeromicrobium sp. YIM 150415 TaxID=2803912 RepID=UPI0019629680|nr:hypothetical protein [Aeromicrobium sp. YIM 150415]MBM9463018.1 hypothetical protein [Aeromicrobium sp. YIM 150415]